VDEETALRLGADGWAGTAGDAIGIVERLLASVDR
jgi:hypothetical protein